MKKSILNLEGVQVLSRNEQKCVLGSKMIVLDDSVGICKATCNDSSLVGVNSCDHATLACSYAGGLKSCSCDYPNPLDPPK